MSRRRRVSRHLLVTVALASSVGACAAPPTAPGDSSRLSRPRADQTTPAQPKADTTSATSTSGYQNPIV